jgi:hypothetical protein
MKRIAILTALVAVAYSHAPAPSVALPIPLAQEAKTTKQKRPARHDLWVRIGRCEQPGRGYKGINWGHRGPAYQGGLGFAASTWAGFRLSFMARNAGDASWRHQMWVANRLYARYGTSPWGCR